MVSTTNECTRLIIAAKEKHLTRLSAKLEDLSTAPKSYWSILNRFLSNKKLPIIPPILLVDRVVSNFAEKTELFNSYFASQCTLVTNKSKLPSLEFKTGKRIEKITFTDDDINLIIKNLNVDKAYGWDNISIRMIKLCGKSIARPLSLIFQSILNDGVFPDDWKKIDIFPRHKKDSKNFIKNYRSISLLPIFSKVFERLIYISLYNYFSKTRVPVWFMPDDSCVANLLLITHEIYNSFDYNSSVDIRGVFLDISEAFDKVWHDGLIFE